MFVSKYSQQDWQVVETRFACTFEHPNCIQKEQNNVNQVFKDNQLFV